MARIAHTTDFSEGSAMAFRHALRLALAAPEQLDILHVNRPGGDKEWERFPHVRETLEAWNLLPVGATVADVEARLGLRVHKVEIDAGSGAAGVANFLATHRPHLLVLATHGREGVNRWLRGSMAEDIVSQTLLPTLLLGPECQSFVDESSGEMAIDRVLMAFDVEPVPTHSYRALEALLDLLGLAPERIDLVHVGDPLPELTAHDGAPRSIEAHSGGVVETILELADARRSHMIVMPTNGRHGFLDAVRGSTTSRVVAHSPCPVLSLPML